MEERDNERNKMKTFIRKYGPGAFVLSLFTITMFYYHHETSDFIPLDIPAPLSYLPNGDWDGIYYTT
jgi:hypothetical protein